LWVEKRDEFEKVLFQRPGLFDYCKSLKQAVKPIEVLTPKIYRKFSQIGDNQSQPQPKENLFGPAVLACWAE
jgi:hypothetical protein